MDKSVTNDSEQAVIVKYPLADGVLGSFEERENAFFLEDQIEALLETLEKVEYDGHEFGNGWCNFYIYGPNAEAMTATLLPFLRSQSLPAGSYLIARSGPPGAPQKRIAEGRLDK